jgi:hypothetical protein
MAEAETKTEIPETDWAALADDGPADESVDFEAEMEQSEEAPPAESSPPPEEPLETAPPVEEPVAETPPEETEPAPEEEPPAVPPPDMTALRQKEIDRMVGVYAIDESDARDLAVEPEKVLPKLAARVYVDTVEAVTGVLGAQLPNVVRELLRLERSREKAEDTFYSKFPALKDAKFEKSVHSAIKVVRAQNPTASMEEVVTQAGITASLANKIPLPAEFVGEAPAPAPTAKPRSFRPAQPGASRPTAPPGPTNEFEKLALEFAEDDRR